MTGGPLTSRAEQRESAGALLKHQPYDFKHLKRALHIMNKNCYMDYGPVIEAPTWLSLSLITLRIVKANTRHAGDLQPSQWKFVQNPLCVDVK